MASINLTFNEERYDFNLSLSKADKNGDAFLYYTIYINGELSSDYQLEEGTIMGGTALPTLMGDRKIFILNYKGYSSSLHITNPNNLEEIVKVITFINKHK
jgi:hypothetical protein